MTADERLYWIWLAEALGAGNRSFVTLIEKFGTARDIYVTPLDELGLGELFPERTAHTLENKLRVRELDRADEILSNCERYGITIVPYTSSFYPDVLRTIPDAPVLLYARGNLELIRDRLLVTVVGTRSMTDYGRRIAYAFGAGLAYGGAVVVSGMALGADSMALIGALDTDRPVVAVLGSGLDVIYPSEHKEVYYKILDEGLVFSEYPPGTPPVGSHFPIRNRIMSGLSAATVVVEAGETSGALITAKRAIEQGRKLFAVPGRVGEENAEGTNALIRDGAIPAVCAEDVLAEFEFMYRDTVSVQQAHARLYNVDTASLSENAMNRMRVGTAGGKRNYYGNGTYGGRIRDAVKKTAAVEKTHETPKPNEPKKPASEPKTVPEPKPETEQKQHRGLFQGFKKENKHEESEKQTVNSHEKMVPAIKIDLELLDENEIKVYNKMKPNVPTLPDELVSADCPISQIMSSLTMLEIAGAVEAGHGGYFMRLSPDDIMQSPND